METAPMCGGWWGGESESQKDLSAGPHSGVIAMISTVVGVPQMGQNSKCY